MHNISHPTSQTYPDQNLSSFGIDPALSSAAFGTGPFNPGIPPSTTTAEQFGFSAAYLDSTTSGTDSFGRHTLPGSDYSNQQLAPSYKQPEDAANLQQERPPNLNLPDSNHQFTSDFADADVFILASSLPTDLPSDPSIDPTDIMAGIVSPQAHLSSPGNLMHVEARSSPHPSPSLQQNSFYSPHHSRHTSLDPARQGYGHNRPQAVPTTDWTGMLGGSSFQQHRRAPSEHSDVSSSVAPSPFLAQHDNFDAFDQHPSPMLNAQPDGTIYPEALGIERFSLSDQQQQRQRQSLNAAHSPFVSPRMSPHQGLGISQDNSHFVLPSNDLNGHFGGGPGPQIYNNGRQPDPGYAGFPIKHESSDMGQAAQMAPPTINVEPAPPSRSQHMEPSHTENDLDALSPPERGTLFRRPLPFFFSLGR